MPAEIAVEFDASVQSLDALNAAVYRLIGTADCQIQRNGDKFVCQLALTGSRAGGPADPVSLRSHFLNLVADENVRERVAAQTGPVRDLILSLAFGSLAFGPGRTR